MKYTLAVIALIAAFYLGAHSQQKGPTFVTGITVNGHTYTGNVHLDFNTQSLMAFDYTDQAGNPVIRVQYLPPPEPAKK